jgi:tetratricopeptide (TPR) repeat protein
MASRVTALLFIALLSVYCPARATGPTDPQLSLQELARATIADNCKAALSGAKELLGSSDFPALPDPMKAAAYQMGARCALRAGQADLAYGWMKAGTQFRGSTAALWLMRLSFELATGRLQAAVATVEAMVPHHVEALNAEPVGWYNNFLHTLEKNGEKDLRTRLLAVLSTAYQPVALTSSSDWYRQDYATILAQGGDRARASQLVASITIPDVLVSVSLDPLLKPMLPANFNIRAAAERHLANVRALSTKRPDTVTGPLEIARTLRLLGRIDESLAVLEKARPSVPSDRRADDSAEQMNWWWNGMAYSYAMLGRYDDAVNAMIHGAGAAEHGGLNVSQRLNLAYLQLRFGRDSDALTTLAQFNTSGAKTRTSGYGAMVMVTTRGCARFRFGDITGAKADIAYATKNEADNPDALTGLLACVNEMDKAAASIIRRLGDPKQRAEALAALSNYDPLPPGFPPGPLNIGDAELAKRDDVKAAAARAGGTGSFRLQKEAF